MKILRRIVLLAIAFFFVELYIDSNVLTTSEFCIKNKKIPSKFDGYKILHLSDLHSKSFGNKNEKLIEKISEINPDIIVMTGDMVNCNDTNFDNFFELVKVLVKKYDIYYIVGNHEQNMKKVNKNVIIDFLEANGVKVLDNEKVELVKEDEKINLYGLWCNLRYYSAKAEGEKEEFTLETIEKIMANTKINDDEYNILLAHNPNFIESYAAWGADLTLSGHIHGGMVRIPFIGGVFSPDTLLFPKYDSRIVWSFRKTTDSK